MYSNLASLFLLLGYSNRPVGLLSCYCNFYLNKTIHARVYNWNIRGRGDGKSLVNWRQPAPFCSAGPVTAIKYLGYHQDYLCICNDFMYIGFKEM